MSKHTPGPWIARLIDNKDGLAKFAIDEENDRGIKPVGTFQSFESVHEVSYQNAHLIAAAPEMLEALEKLVAQWESQGWFQKGSRKDLDEAVLTIKKAKGE